MNDAARLGSLGEATLQPDRNPNEPKPAAVARGYEHQLAMTHSHVVSLLLAPDNATMIRSVDEISDQAVTALSLGRTNARAT